MATAQQKGVAMRPKTLIEMQPYFWTYGFCISLFSPTASVYQLAKLNPQVNVTGKEMLKLSARILPHQTFLKAAQMTASTPVKEALNPWAAFAVVGVLQGGVYGQSNIHFSSALKIGKDLSYKGMFRGAAFAGGRDMISQGVPFVLSGHFRKYVVDQVYPSNEGPADGIKHWCALLSTSIFATFASQGLHNCQITMQAQHDLTYASTIRKVWSENGIKFLWRGGEARVGLLLIVNVLNELLLKPAWEMVPCEE
eukprot:CAMPEP_0203752878 /NCGR_PEP_ID=MMETSP0098-20131031/6741_1 /ASSEMBLY_ACC=CAM_ASM_000208 /TAXON_ID=96639 /ORGANISM=" , Strain NY0313808BC1" /LENGTH=252 /DNA_ID=CAMNT_0050643245 /DNA_START=30 /DNA_END=788 /DNA_ORIENTATION=-